MEMVEEGMEMEEEVMEMVEEGSAMEMEEGRREEDGGHPQAGDTITNSDRSCGSICRVISEAERGREEGAERGREAKEARRELPSSTTLQRYYKVWYYAIHSTIFYHV